MMSTMVDTQKRHQMSQWKRSDDIFCANCNEKKTMFPRAWILSWSLRLDCQPTPEAVGARVIELTEQIKRLERDLRHLKLQLELSPVLSCPMEEDSTQ